MASKKTPNESSFSELPPETLPSASFTPPRGLGHKMPSEPDPRDFRAGAMLGAPRGLYAEAMGLLDYFDGHVKDQKATSACVGFACYTGIELRLAKLGVKFHGSEMGGYTLGRMLGLSDGERLVDDGSLARLVLKGVKDFGVIEQSAWPFSDDPKIVNKELPLDVYQNASARHMSAWYRLDKPGYGKLDQICQAVAMGHPVPFAVTVDQRFMELSGKKPVEGFDPATRVGGHMMLVVGYTTVGGKRLFRVLNSWGSGWGDGGFCWMTEAAMLDETAGDFFAMQVG